MVSRIFVGGLLGAIAMFVWMSIAHMATPLSSAGFSQLPNEGPAVAALYASAGDKAGLYFFPWMDPKDPGGMAGYEAKTKASASGMVLYHAPGQAPGFSLVTMFKEFLKELVVCVIAAFLLAEAKLPKLWERAGFVAAIGVVASLETNASYRIWYGFPGDFTAAAILMSFVGYVAAGFAIGWWVKPSTPKPIE